ncbi:MAG: efflux RND transporter periplasmic adaptor subunit [Deltaproteobacteria bacterium]|nr:efflux RND transporter periplasmic adaptor subunit [Deltaproteobacteria bacterium]
MEPTKQPQSPRPSRAPTERPNEDLHDLLAREVDPVRLRRRRLRLAALGGLGLLGVIWMRSGGGGEEPALYQTEPVEKGNLVVTVSATGTLQPTNKVEVGSELSGIVDTVSVDFNDRVRKGQVLAKLDVSKLSAAVVQSQAQLDVNKSLRREKEATVAEATAELERLAAVRKASGGRLPSQHDMDVAAATLERARASVDNAAAQIELAAAKLDVDQTNLAKAEIRAPIDGIVLSRKVEPGQTLAASLQTPVLFTLAEDLAQMELEVDVDEADVGQVRDGMSATFTVDAYSDRRFPAKITQLRYASETVDNVVTYKAVLVVANPDLALRPGMTATADIVISTVDDAVLIPNAALRFIPPRAQDEKDDRSLLQKLMPFSRRLSASKRPPADGAGKGSKRSVYVLEDGRPREVSVTIGASDGSRTQVLSGDLRPGTQVVVDATTKSS